ncbi:hypothetical protein GLOIN_2v1495217 [Rhizophagus clarus]|uniref:Uncharacterized protein n=1 Tax=Rhizophagus clarus TaxID=94130 RepID=A0A8H3MC74_9GLOM|nr:hypothetical protein GLOIN_2v1495217 [Rhizophagus clarus]
MKKMSIQWIEMALDPDTLCLLSILDFHKTKLDFSFDKHIKHLTISKFISYVTNNTTDEKWKKATSILNDGLLKAKVAEATLRQAEAKFAVDQSLTGNKANAILNKMKLDFILNQKDKPIIGSKQTYPNEKSTLSTPSTSSNKEKSNSRNIFPNILLDDTVDYDKKIPTLDNILCSPCQLISKIGIYPWEKLTAEEKATLTYGVSRVIDLSAHMRAWFTEVERQDVMKDYEEILKIPKLTEDINEFIAKVEKEGDANGTYKYCLNQHADASVNTWFYKISKIYGDFLYKVKDGNVLLYCGGKRHTEIDVIVKTCSYIVNGLQNGTGIYSTPTKAIEDRCRSARINQSILNGLLSRDLIDAQVSLIKVPYLQIAGVFCQLLVEDLEIYKEVNEIFDELNHSRNLLEDIFKVDDVKSLSCKLVFIHKPWWTPKNKSQRLWQAVMVKTLYALYVIAGTRYKKRCYKLYNMASTSYIKQRVPVVQNGGYRLYETSGTCCVK